MKKLLLFMFLTTLLAPITLCRATVSTGGTDCSSALALPFTEDFTGVAAGQVPTGWDRTHVNWGVYDSNWAGGEEPEMKLSNLPSATGQIKLITPELDGTSAFNILLSFRHLIACMFCNFTLRIQTSTDNGATWQDRWSMADKQMGGEVFIYLNNVLGQKFKLAFVFEGDTSGIIGWCIDDICVSEHRELDMLNPVGWGAVAPGVGRHDIPIDREIILGALPSSTWYAFVNSYPVDAGIVFDPMNPSDFSVIGPNTPEKIAGGTWAGGTWYASSDPISYNSTIYTVNPFNGTMTEVGSSGAQIYGLAYDEVNDILYGSSHESLYTISQSTGAAAFIGNYDGFPYFRDIAYGNGVLYGYSSYKIYAIDVNTAATTLIGPTGYIDIYVSGMEYDKDHDRLFFLFGFAQESKRLAEVDLSTGRAVCYGAFGETTNPRIISGLAIPYGIDHPWVFDRWEVDGMPYSNDPLTTLKMDANHTAQAFFGIPFKLTMQAPGGIGTGSVTPVPGTYTYLENTVVDIVASAAFGSVFDYWEVNSVVYSLNPTETLLMDKDYTVRAYFRLFPTQPLPFTEDFTGVAEGDIPAGWNRTHVNWGVADSNQAGGTAPELKFNSNPQGGSAVYRLSSPKLNGATASSITLTFKHLVNDKAGGYILRIQTSTDGGSTWRDRWSMLGQPMSGQVVVNLDAVAGKEFQLAFVFDGDTNDIINWSIDDITVAKPSEPTPTNTPKPTATEPPATPTQPPTSTPTGAHTPTPTQPPEPTPTETPEPTPSYPLGVRLDMPDMAHPGDEFSIIGYLDNPDAPLAHVATFFILEVYGKFWFWPSWVYFDYPEYPEIDFEYIDVPTGTTEIIVIPPFEWPDTGQDIVTGLGFYGAMLNPEMNDIMGEIAIKSWGYGP
ncbi:MAG: hypothetical protein WBM02_02545 [bacterium]